MKIALYTKSLRKDLQAVYKKIFATLDNLQLEFLVNEAFKPANVFSDNYCKGIFSNYIDLLQYKPDFFISIGGDGTLLDALSFVKDQGIPVLGFNAGHLGFLSNNPVDNISNVFADLVSSNYEIDERSLIELQSDKQVFGETNFALNDFTIHKRDNSSLTAISTYLNGEFFNTYWGDGIIVSTPTGSTAYSMSCGGPIVFPESNNFIITPVAPHNLNVRPVIVPDSTVISFKIKVREKKFILALDSQYKVVDQSCEIIITKAGFKLKTVRFKNQYFSNIIREKLMWGADSRNN